MSLVEFEEWFEGNESKFEYPRLAHKSAKQAWNYQQGEVDKLQTEIDEITKQRDSFIKAHHISMNDVCEHKDKIDEVNEKHSEEKRILHNVIEMNQAKIDELQKRIDDASNKIDFWVGGKNGDAIHVAKSIGNILKGNKDEN